MKLRVFHAADGDCLLLSSSDGHHALIDGGRTGSFRDQTWKALQGFQKADEALDLVVVSHIDADHISGILWLMKAVAAWAVYDFQTTDGDNPGFPRPSVARPPTIHKVWHNSWRAQLGDLVGPIEALAARVSNARLAAPTEAAGGSKVAVTVLDAFEGLAESIPDGVELRRVLDDDTPIPRNTPFGELVLLQEPPHVEKLGTARLTVIGPAKKHLERLRQEWRRWLADLPPSEHPADNAAPGRAPGLGLGLGGTDFGAALAANAAEGQTLVAALTAAADIIAMTDPSKVTPPNRASITLLAEEKKRTCLLTGDASEEEILEGLKAAGRIVDGRFWCNVLKVQHHGSEHNLSVNFAATVPADHYVFCADGAHNNPDPSVVRTIIETRLTEPEPFTIWFNCAPERTLPSRQRALRAAIREATSAAGKHAGITVKILGNTKPSFEISV